MFLEKIYGFVLPEHLASIRVLEKVGMSPDGAVMYEDLLTLRYVKQAARVRDS